MSTRNLLILLVPLVLLAGLVLALEPGSCKGSKCEDASVSSGTIYDADVERVVRNFGAAMKRVSVLSPTAAADIDANYAAYVAPELLTEWKTDPTEAPGRQTSSPWPDRIQIGQMQQSGDAFIVHATVVEVVTGTDGKEDIVGTYPVELRVEERGGAWLITAYEEGAYSRIPARATIVGTLTCLPHRDTTGPQTMECAFGIQDEASGENYAVDTRLMASMIWTELASGSRVEVEGVLVPIEQLSTDSWQKYDIVGIISATSIRGL